jgi:hypothetical protein
VTGVSTCGAIKLSQSEKEDTRMSLNSHLAALREKHAHLSEKVDMIQRSPGSSDLEIASLKKQKLRLKEEIERLSHA